MLEFQVCPPIARVELAYCGTGASQLTSPADMTAMLVPWRNHPSHRWDRYSRDFPLTAADIGIHDALHRLDASVLLDRPVMNSAMCVCWASPTSRQPTPRPRFMTSKLLSGNATALSRRTPPSWGHMPCTDGNGWPAHPPLWRQSTRLAELSPKTGRHKFRSIAGGF